MFLLGVLAVQFLAELPSPFWSLVLVPLALVAMRWPRWSLPVLFLAAGFSWAVIRSDAVLRQELPASLEGTDLTIDGRIADLPSPLERGVRLVVDVEPAGNVADRAPVPRRIQLNRYGHGEQFRVGDLWRFTVRLRRPHGFRNPGGFDQEAHLFQQHIRATGYIRDLPAPRLLTSLERSGGWLPGFRLNRYRQQLSERIRTLMPDQPMAGLIVAFANGDDDGVPAEQWRILTRTGTSHLVAISGMNIGLVAGLAFLLVRATWVWLGRASLWIPAPQVATVGALAAATGYAALAGFAIPTQRALVMIFTILAGRLIGRDLELTASLALALLAVLLVDPLAVLSPGFWLSFLAVAVILLVIQSTERSSRKARIIAWGYMQLAITAGMIPVLLYLFQQVSVAGPLANLVAIPVVELVVIPATLIGVTATMVLPEFLAGLPFRLAATALEWLWPVLDWLGSGRYAMWIQAPPPLWSMVAATLGTAILLLPRGFPMRWSGVFWWLPLLLARPPSPAPGAIWLTMLDVGQGLSVVVRTAQHTLVYDTGARYSNRFDAGQAVVVPYLRQVGVARLDLLVVSHGDNDHIGGAASVVSAYTPDRILTGVPERLSGAARCEMGETWTWDGVRFRMLGPQPIRGRRGNNASCVLMVEGAGGKILIPGDIGARAERDLMIEDYDGLRSTVLVVPHHGSRSSSTESFLDAVQPQAALLSAGYRNRYGHPHRDVVARYRERGIRILDSATSGAVEMRFESIPGRFTESRYREERRRFWHDR